MSGELAHHLGRYQVYGHHSSMPYFLEVRVTMLEYVPVLSEGFSQARLGELQTSKLFCGREGAV